ncbi:hypothetical protein PIB30_024634 [Stylosanthes scabra]|uniref:Uncharacterized protein n=1 Tax=Stylosanthes scabra TaxID=79078 RepID=A0ABU6W9V4_9FABA|nr:hypothetical protein [Stylosanthes scabra]
MDGLAGLRNEIGAANGAGCVGGEPLVDALRMEDVVTLWNQTQRFGVLELAEAHRTFQNLFPDLVDLDFRILQNRKSLDHRRIKSPRRPSGPSSACSDWKGGAGGRIGAVTDVNGEESHEEECCDENDDDYCQGRAQLRVVVVICVRSVILVLRKR